MNGPIPFTERQLHTMATLYASGVRINQIAETYGVSHPVVRDRLQSMGVVLKRRGAPAKMDCELFDSVARLRTYLCPWKMVANRVGYTGDARNLAQQYNRINAFGRDRYFGGRPKLAAYPPAMLRCARSMHGDGLTWPVIATIFDVSHTALNHAVMELNRHECTEPCA
jgi:hypothetical protein